MKENKIRKINEKIRDFGEDHPFILITLCYGIPGAILGLLLSLTPFYKRLFK